MTLFAGPNGSGKSTIVNRIRQNEEYPYASGTLYLNADELEQHLRANSYCDLRAYDLHRLPPTEWNGFVQQSSMTAKVCEGKQIAVEALLDYVKLVHGALVVRGTELEPDSYLAALITEFIREALIRTHHEFAFETVMSHPSKLEMMQRAKEAGFRVCLYFVTTRDPDINVARVRNRVALGGHPVNEGKIRSRYTKGLANLADALRLADEAYLFDNSTDGRESIEVARKEGPKLTVVADAVPVWYIEYVETKFS